MKNLIHFWLLGMNKYLAVLIVFFVAITGTLFYIWGIRTQKSLSEQTLHREQVIARAGASSIEHFFALAGNSLGILVRNPEESEMDEFAARFKDSGISGVIKTDEKGIVTYLTFKESAPIDKGASVSDRKYFSWAKTPEALGRVYLGQPIISRLGASKGKYVVPIAAPYYQEGSFKGVVVTAIPLEKLTNLYLDHLKISEKTNIYLVDSEETFLSSPFSELTGSTIFDSISKSEFPGKDILIEKVKRELADVVSGKKDEGKLAYVRPNFEDKRLRQMLLSYSVLDFKNGGVVNLETGGKRWILVVETPAEDAYVFMAPFAQNQIVALVLPITIIIFFSLVVLISVKVAHREAFEEGYREAWTKKVSKK